MGKKDKNSSSLGRSLIRDRFNANKGKKYVSGKSLLHTTEIQDGYDWGRLNLQSVTEESSFQDFLSTAELAGTEFQAEKLNIKFINPKSNVGLLTGDELKKAQDSHKEYKDFLKIPRRPPWNSQTTPEILDQNEREHFLEWRRTLAKLQEDRGILLTPYEKNLEFWRQLWRVVERSDVVVQIVDARNPLLFRCEDLEKYVKEVSTQKMNLILINKADFLNEQQRGFWAEYFSSIGVQVVFFSAIATPEVVEESSSREDLKELGESREDLKELGESREDLKEMRESREDLKELGESREDLKEMRESREDLKELGESREDLKEMRESREDLKELRESTKSLEASVEKTAKKLDEITSKIQQLTKEDCINKLKNSSKLLSRDELISFFHTLHKGVKVTENITTIGLVGYPNVGKSSTINTLLTVKKVSVSATPGKTKHFQTLFLDKNILLCDCPGLVMPSFVCTKAEMIINGILPIDQMRDHVPPINLVSNLIPRHVIEDKYGIMLPLPLEGEDPNRNPIAEELLNAYGFNRGFMTANGQPDNARSARYVLKDYINGKLLYCHAPPGVDQSDYHQWLERQKISSTNRVLPPRQLRAVKPNRLTTEDVDKMFFKNSGHQVHSKGVVGKSAGIPQGLQNGDVSGGDKPWKKIHKHENKNKREKLRRLYVHLDQH